MSCRRHLRPSHDKELYCRAKSLYQTEGSARARRRHTRPRILTIAGVQVREATPDRRGAAIWSIRRACGDVLAVQDKTNLKGGLRVAMRANVLVAKPLFDVSQIRFVSGPKGCGRID